ncbi:MAG TPA: tRNA (guanosine(37)-N1)-methyltransferase TrmD [Caldisericia bacterium]|nr:tRNA (guanosine(37)-N1)-methyltransferase TrmD [Caldisericia bacterium]HPF48522.1 tRNA (guanosine(37)-N1)-methyltransferase TrmD [Caldisericia bacterium]HPI84608.1 tRNA (guanosine(37)-N1)-methyltransferase TrmD [Caldisericia bacterium]HPQ92977.1 tRNA (guanosine(37)-N1)-methyltransferase TrmD [Caldisericia bacterium]HRV75189.1 tRNA (guanosine(37)-N1)-methyltransferase TrmD [Caldisericia bacterium]
MRLVFATTFPEFFEDSCKVSIMGRAVGAGLIEFQALNIRNFATDSHKTTDDRPFGGGAGMLLKPEPVLKLIDSLNLPTGSRVVLTSPAGKTFTQEIAHEMSNAPAIAFICGHYEGVDERISEVCTDWLSIGDFVMTGGEFAALCMADAITRLIPGVLGKEDSLNFESFSEGLLEYPQYTRPAELDDKVVPEVLRSGDHTRIAKWRREQALRRTLLLRPELLLDANLTKEDKEILKTIVEQMKSVTKDLF